MAIKGAKIGAIPHKCAEGPGPLNEEVFILDVLITHDGTGIDSMCEVLGEMSSMNRRDVTFTLDVDFAMEDVDGVRPVENTTVSILEVGSEFVGDDNDDFQLCGQFKFGFDLSQPEIKELRDDLSSISIDHEWDREDIQLKIHDYGPKVDRAGFNQSNPEAALAEAAAEGDVPDEMAALASMLLD